MPTKWWGLFFPGLFCWWTIICPTNHWKWVITRSSPLLRTLGNTKNHRSRVFCFCAKMYPMYESFYEMMKCLIDVVRTYHNRISRWYVSTFRTNAMGFITYPSLVHQHTPWLSKVVLLLSLNDFIMLTSWLEEVTQHNSPINHAHTAPVVLNRVNHWLNVIYSRSNFPTRIRLDTASILEAHLIIKHSLQTKVARNVIIQILLTSNKII